MPGPLPHPADLYNAAAADKERELAKLSALPGPLSAASSEDSRNRRSLSPSRDTGKSPSDTRSPDPKKLKKDEVRDDQLI